MTDNTQSAGQPSGAMSERELLKLSGRIHTMFSEVKEYMTNPSRYCNYHSTTKDGMLMYVRALENECQGIIAIARRRPQEASIPSEAEGK